MNNIIMTPEEFKNEMQKLDENGDTEVSHSNMDDLMCDLLESLGYKEGIKIFKASEKWYA